MRSAGREAIRTKPNMPATKVIKPETVATSRKSVRESNPVRVKQAAAQLRAPAVRNGRASSCPRCPQHTATQPGCKRKARSSSTTAAGPATRPGRPREASGTGHQREPRAESAHNSTAFTVIPPDPKKRKDIQRKAEAELAALEELRLSQAMAYVCISPSSVGGCLSLEEVRLKQQQEMVQAKAKQKLVRPRLMQGTPVLSGRFIS
ncbi:uncharacterized protein LOC142903492 [Nelusetta ayraudi]|uniref:uncharacterized protein LOC142903492 n=1 Tax=Nelusetta ayraudi TaxID=303726 RepID=UPI003F6EDBE8